jgi:predicted ATPase
MCGKIGVNAALERPRLEAAVTRVADGERTGRVPNNLPDPLTSFFGRERELDELRQALAQARLLTLVGAGGCGKTRLALEMAADAVGRFRDGAWWIDLAPHDDGALVGQELASALGVRPLAGQSYVEAAVSHLAQRSALVAFDNCEHLRSACAEAAEALLHGCPKTTVLATSRAPLGVAGEVA